MRKWVVSAIAFLVVILVIVWLRRPEVEPVTNIDLIMELDRAEKRSTLPVDEAIGVVTETIEGEAKQAIYAHPTTRIIWKIPVPDDAWLGLALGLRADVWDREGDGVLFRIGVSDGRTYEELLSQHVNPSANPGDRRWVPVMIDLSAYGGEEVDLIFNTNSSLPGQGEDSRNDWALWGAPQVYAQ